MDPDSQGTAQTVSIFLRTTLFLVCIALYQRTSKGTFTVKPAALTTKPVVAQVHLKPPVKKKKKIYLTFDDGPNKGTQKVLHIMQEEAVPVTFFGHTHLQGGFVAQGEISEAYRPGYRTVGQPESSDWPLRRELRFLINPGSVGQPRDGDWRAAFAMFDSDSWIVSYYRIPYNLRVAQEKIIAANLPQRLATRLATGR